MTCSRRSKTALTQRSASTMREILAPIIIEITIVMLGIVGGIVIVKEIM